MSHWHPGRKAFSTHLWCCHHTELFPWNPVSETGSKLPASMTKRDCNPHPIHSVVLGRKPLAVSQVRTSIPQQPVKHDHHSGHTYQVCNLFCKAVKVRGIVVRKSSYMWGDEVGNEVEAKTPPNGAENVPCDFCHSSHQADAVVHFWEELEQKN